MLNLLNKLFKQSGIYAFGDILTKGVGFLLLPLYTAYLTPEDYGIISLALVVASIYSIIATGGLKGAVLKFYYDFDEEEIRKAFYGTLWLFYIFIPGFILLFFEFKGDLIFGKILPSVGYHPYLRLALWAIYINSVFFEIPLHVFKASGKAKNYTLLNIAIFTASTIFTIWFVVYLEQGAKGLLFAKFLGSIVIATAMAFYLFKLLRLGFQWSWLQKALLYSLPLVPHFLSHWVLGSSDRLVLEYFVPLSEVGVYNVGYTIGSAMSMIAVAGNNAIIPMYGKLELGDKSAIQEVVHTATYYIAVITSIGLLISLFAGDFIHFAIPESYHGAIGVVPWVVLGYVFMALYFTQINLLTITLGKTNVVGISTAVAAVLNVGLNILLIPYLGMIGAAITTAFTYLVLFGGMLYFSKKAEPLPFEFYRMTKIIIVAIITFLGSYYLAPEILYLSIFVKAGAVILFGILLYLVGFLNEREITFIKSKLNY